MVFWASAEVFRLASDSLTATWRSVEPLLNAMFEASSLALLDCELRYIPIVMPEAMRGRYPARSALRKKEQIFICAPQLDYDVFVDGSFEDQLREYLRGIAESGPHLADLGASPQQVEDFNRIMASAVERILAERPDQTRH